MKHILSVLIAGSLAISANAQHALKDMPRWSIDADLFGGGLSQSLTGVNMASAYTSSVNNNISDLKSKGRSSLGGDIGLGYFFDKRHHWGLGTGVMLMQQKSEIGVDKFHTEYRSVDFKNEVFRQSITANGPITEKITSTGINVPLVLKYQTQFSEKFGLMIDAGALFNLSQSSKYSTDASFDYEAIYKFSGADHGAVYDAAVTPDGNDWLITKAAYTGEMTKFDKLKAQGYNIGLGVKSSTTSGTVAYKSGSVGLLLQPAISYRLGGNMFLKVGLTYTMQSFSNDASSSYMVTDKAGDYRSLLNGITRSANSTYGANIGVRCFIGKAKDRDHDGVADKRDRCPDVPGLLQFEGCPDTDKDGIKDADDSCPKVAGLLQYNGCPDSDGDGIQDKDDACPGQKGSDAFKGCPDSDGDGVQDKEDNCPSVAGLKQFHGCPDTDGDGIPDNEDKCPNEAGPASNNGCPVPAAPKPEPVAEPEATIDMSSPILFGKNKTTLQADAYPVLDEVARTFTKTPGAYIQLDGYTDSKGSIKYNKTLSRKRAGAVKAYLVKKGVNAKQIKIVGHGSKDPETTNKTKVGRAQNRRVKIKLEAKAQ